MIITFNDLKDELEAILLSLGLQQSKADVCAKIFAENTRDGVRSHGINRFPVFVKYIQKGLVAIDTEPEVIHRSSAMEVWDGKLGPGPYNATLAVQRAVELAKENSLGCVALRNTNHWMRGGTYALQAAEQSCVCLASTNAIANMPPYGGDKSSIGNNPLVIGIPKPPAHVVLDMAISQFSFGKLDEYESKQQQLPVDGGYDSAGRLSKDPSETRKAKRVLPIGFWKGSGLSMVLDMLVTGLSGGKSVADITREGKEFGVSQFFLCINAENFSADILENIIAFTKDSQAPGANIYYPGEKSFQHRQQSEADGITIEDEQWAALLALKSK